MNQEHNITTWFGTADDAFVKYFEGDFSGNTIGTLKFPASHVRRHLGLTIKEDKYAAARGIANVFIGGIVKMKAKQLSNTPFALLEIDTKIQLRDAVCEAVQHAVQNRTIWERINSSSITTNSFTINNDTPGWILTADIYGKFAWIMIQNSGIDEYQWVTEEALAIETANGNTKLIGRADYLEENFWKVAQ